MPNIKYFIAALGDSVLRERMRNPLPPDIDRAGFLGFAERLGLAGAFEDAFCVGYGVASE